jgi:hypothetical protein
MCHNPFKSLVPGTSTFPRCEVFKVFGSGSMAERQRKINIEVRLISSLICKNRKIITLGSKV